MPAGDVAGRLFAEIEPRPRGVGVAAAPGVHGPPHITSRALLAALAVSLIAGSASPALGEHATLRPIRFLGEGSIGSVHLVEDTATGKLWAWKRAKANGAVYQRSLREEVELAKEWTRLGLSDITVKWHPDGASLLKSFVEGPTLNDITVADPHFFSRRESPMYRALTRFVEHAIRQGVFIDDLGLKNLIYADERWVLIDSAAIEQMTPAAARRRYVDDLFGRWNRRLTAADHGDLRRFLDELR
jgi:hypothetical protein